MTKPVITKRLTKGSLLTYEELDQNFQNLADSTLVLKAGTGVTDVTSDLNGTITLVAGSNITLTGNNTAKTITIAGSAGGLTDIVNDTTPQLGGALDINGQYFFDSTTSPTDTFTFGGTGASNAILQSNSTGNLQLKAGTSNINIANSGSITLTAENTIIYAVSDQLVVGDSTGNPTVKSVNSRDLTVQGAGTYSSRIILQGRGSGGVADIQIEPHAGSIVDISSNVSIDGGITVNGVPQTNATIDVSGNAGSYANNATVDFANFSGVIIINAHSTGKVEMLLCGGGSLSSIGSSITGTSTGSMSAVSGINGYRWTNTTGSTGTFSFAVIRTRTTG
jgi:hypothetical protein